MSLEALAVASLIGLGVVLWRRRARSVSLGLPPEIRSAKLIYAERLFRSGGATSITAKVDRAYRVPMGNVVLVELKTREADRVYWSDVIELSAQRVAVMAETEEVVANHAYVLTQRPDGHSSGCHRVRLMTQKDVFALAARRYELLAGIAESRPASSPGICPSCAFVRSCRDRYGECSPGLDLHMAAMPRSCLGGSTLRSGDLALDREQAAFVVPPMDANFEHSSLASEGGG